jgi:hypothetical protein
MHVQYVTQPDVQLGATISELLEAEPLPRQVIFVSAFVGLQAVTRFKESVKNLKSHGSAVRLVLGIDMGGTSQEVLKESRCSLNAAAHPAKDPPVPAKSP